VTRRLVIDFAARRWTGWLRDPVALLLVIATLVTAALWAMAASNQRAELADAERQLRAEARARERTSETARSLRATRLTPARARAVNDAIRRLNLPWEAILGALNDAAMPQVALLSLDPDPTSGVVRLTAEARTVDAMLTFHRRVQGQPALAGAALAKHELRRGEAGQVRFVLEARWSAP